MTEEEKLAKINDLVSHIDLFINGNYKFSFAYPIGIPEGMLQLRDHLDEMAGQTGNVSDTMGALVQAVGMNIKDLTLQEIDEDTRHRVVFLFCGFILQMSDDNDQEMVAGNPYRLNIDFDEAGSMTVEMCDVIKE